MRPLELDINALSPMHLRRLTSVLVLTRRSLMDLRDRITACLREARAQSETGADDSNVDVMAAAREAQDIRRELEELSWRFIGMEMPSTLAKGRMISLTDLIFESESLFGHLTGKRYHTTKLNEGWLVQLRELVEGGLNTIPTLYACVCYPMKCGVLLAVDPDEAVPDVAPPDMPSTECLASNSKGPHSISVSLKPDTAVREMAKTKEWATNPDASGPNRIEDLLVTSDESEKATAIRNRPDLDMNFASDSADYSPEESLSPANESKPAVTESGYRRRGSRLRKVFE